MTTCILDPRKPRLIFDGQVKVYSTCRGCDELMQVTNPYEHVHPGCSCERTELEKLSTRWLDALCNDKKSLAAQLKREIEAKAAEPPDLHSAAVNFASWGWPVFPLRPAGGKCTGGDRCKPVCQCPKQPAISSAHPKGDPLQGKCKGECGKPGHGFHDATNDVARIGKWWTRHPTHNIGLATGKAFDVIDVDPRNGGVQSFMKQLELGDLPEIHGVAVTSGGGMHLYVKARNSKSFPGLKPGIDYKARLGYVVGPPSTLGAPGRDYSWLTDPSPALKGFGT